MSLETVPFDTLCLSQVEAVVDEAEHYSSVDFRPGEWETGFLSRFIFVDYNGHLLQFVNTRFM